jgi:hypothetical protein
MSTPPTFKPATTLQLNAWCEWLSSPEALKAERQLAHLEKTSREAFATRKFVCKSMEAHCASMWPDEKATFMLSPLWMAYASFKAEQDCLLKTYTSVCKRTNQCEEAEDAYKNLLKHIHTHGELIDKIPSCPTKKPSQPTNDTPHVGRRAQRKATDAM